MKRIKYTSKFGIALLLLGVALTLGGLTVAYAARSHSSVLISATAVSQVATANGAVASETNNSAAHSSDAAQQSAQASPTPQSGIADTNTLSAPPTSTSVIASSPAASVAATAATATATSAPASTAQQAVPDQAIINDFPALAQAYNLSCEYAAASAVTLFWGKQVSESVFVSQVPSSPNPHLGFRGDINGAFGGINDYGVYAEALVPVLEKYGYNAAIFYGGVSELKANVAAGKPVVVWITTGKYTKRTPVTQSYNGETFTLVPGEHAVVIYGYDSGGVYIMDVSNGSFHYTEWSSFLTRWGYFDQMALVITPK